MEAVSSSNIRDEAAVIVIASTCTMVDVNMTKEVLADVDAIDSQG